jgi:hypothetical protein
LISFFLRVIGVDSTMRGSFSHSAAYTHTCTMWASPRTPAGFAECKWPYLRFRLVLEPWAGDTLLDVATLVDCLAAPAFICRSAKLRSEIDRLAPSCFAAFWLSRTPVAGL